MDYSRPELADRLAAEHVLGTLRGPARRRFDALLPAHPALQKAVRRWQDALIPLATPIPPVAPPPRVWAALEQRLFAPAVAKPGGLRRWLDWRPTVMSLGLAALVLGVSTLRETPSEPPVLVVMAPNPSAQADPAMLQQARFVASFSADGRALVLQPLAALPLENQRALELWAVPAQGAPRSLGLVTPNGPTRLLRTAVRTDTSALAISIEPPGGSPTGAPTGPVIALGPVQL